MHFEPEALIDALVKLMRTRDTATAEHLVAVRALARDLSAFVGLSPQRQRTTEIAAALHDIGKFSISPRVLTKAGPLLPSEWDEMRRHPELGAATIRCFSGFEAVADIVAMHHERVDGRGYPLGLSGDEIPIEARLIAVVDAFHAMTVPRVYTPHELTPAEAMVELRRCADTQFDADLVDAFVDFLGGRRHEHRIA